VRDSSSSPRRPSIKEELSEKEKNKVPTEDLTTWKPSGLRARGEQKAPTS